MNAAICDYPHCARLYGGCHAGCPGQKRESIPHKVMTLEEYAATPIIGWHEVCRNVDGFGGVGVRYLANTK